MEDKKSFTFEDQSQYDVSACGYGKADDHCGAPATRHLIFDGGSTTAVVCEEHYNYVMGLEGVALPEAEHPITPECTMPGTYWFDSTPERPGFCSVSQVH